MLLKKLGAEFSILREVPQEDIRTVGGEALAEGTGGCVQEKLCENLALTENTER